VAIKLSNDAAFLLLTIKDSGAGIEAAQLKKIFDPYYQAETGIKHNYNSSGVGLALVKELVELHRGSVAVQSVLHKGSTFEIQLPVKNLILADRTETALQWMEEHNERQDIEITTEPGKRQIHKTIILVAEDNPVNQKWTIKILSKMGYQAVIAENGKMVLEIVGHEDFDLILMDVQMPEMDGLEATKMIRLCNDKQPVIIAMTANVMHGDRQACIQAGMDDYISKPVELAALVDMLEKWALVIRERN